MTGKIEDIMQEFIEKKHKCIGMHNNTRIRNRHTKCKHNNSRKCRQNGISTTIPNKRKSRKKQQTRICIHNIQKDKMLAEVADKRLKSNKRIHRIWIRI